MSQVPGKPRESVTDAKWLNWLPVIAGMLATILIGSYIFTFQKLPPNESPAAWGTFGDYMGGLLNPLISLFTLIVAMKVWGLQKTELLETRRAVEEQGKTAEQQRREQRFFDLLNLYQETLKTFVIDGSVGKAALNGWHKLSPSDKECWFFLYRGWDEFDFQYDEYDLHSRKLVKKVRKKTYSQEEIAQTWDKFSPLLDHYFRTIFSILGELERLLGTDHWRYGKLFRAQLSGDELTLLAFNVLFDSEGEKMRALVYKYGLLKHLANTKLRDHAIMELSPTAFGLNWANAQRTATSQENHHAA